MEARWDSTEKDRAGNFYGASYFASQDDQVNTIYLYNYVRGQLKDIPDLTNNVKLYLGKNPDMWKSDNRMR